MLHFLLFSGEFKIFEFAHRSLSLTPSFLIMVAIIKAAVANFGFALGWRGGTIFPAIFAGVACGATLVHFLPWMPELTITIVAAASLASILDKPLLSAILIMVLFPIQYLPLVIVVCYLTNYLKKKWYERV